MSSCTHIWPDDIGKNLKYLAKFLTEERLALMVGAGFSKNAINPKNLDIPNWNYIRDKLNSELYPGTTASKDVLSLADEYVDNKGQIAFDSFILKVIPDDELFPSAMHQRLLKLPWNDVFTTNYDTLLERAAKSLIATKYNVVTCEEQLMQIAPRIIKLHGSFPDKIPFIMSGEHYRTYEDKYPGFTNTIRQSLIESALCLIGFSGVDPNFKEWIGWIRDNFKKNNPIFLIECRDIPAPELISLNAKNITVINLADCKEFKGDFGEALEQLISFCEDSCEVNMAPVKWPICDNIDLINPSADDFDIQKLLGVWKNERANYPNWLILPQNNRQRLWLFTERHFDFYIRNKGVLNFPQDLDYVYELTWRMDKCLMPLYRQVIFNSLLDVVKCYNPFHGSNTYTGASHLPSNSGMDGIDWNNIKLKWVEIIFVLSRQARLENNESLVDFLLNNLLNADIVSEFPAWEAKWYYERGLRALANFDIKGVTDVLTKWERHETLFYESLWQASLWCELGENNKAEQLLEQAFTDIRQAVISPDSDILDYLHRDTENYILGFLQILKQVDSFNIPMTDFSEYQEEANRRQNNLEKWQNDVNRRWNSLKKYGCDFGDELSFFNDKLIMPPTGFNTKVEHVDFFSGHVRYSNNVKCVLGNDNIAGFTLPVFAEQSGCPYRVGHVNTYSPDIVINAATWLYQLSWGHYSILMMVRLGNEKKFVDNVFTRKMIAELPVKQADEVVKVLVSYLTPLVEKGANTSILQSNFQSKACKVLPFILGRFATICSSISLKNIFVLVSQFYSYSHTRRICLKDETDFLWEGAFANRRWSELEDIFLDVLRLPVPQEKAFCANDPILYIAPKCNLTEDKHFLLTTKISPEIDRLLTEAETMPSEALITRLMHLNFLTLLIDIQKLRFAKILWSDSNLGEDGLPKSISRKSWLLSLPRLNENNESKIKKYLLTLSPPFRDMRLSGMELKEKLNTISVTGGLNILFFDELFFACKEDKFIKKDKYLILTEQDAIGIYNKLLDWWNTDKQSVIDNFGKTPESPLGSVEDEIRQRFYNISEMLSEVIIPALGKNISPQMLQQVINIVEDLRKIEIPCSSVHLALLPNNPKGVSNTKNIILEELATGKPYNIQVAHRSIVKWLNMCKLGFITCDLPKELMDVWENSLMLGMKSHFDFWLMHVIDNRLYKVDIYKISLFLDNMLTQVNKQNVDELSKDPLSGIEIASRLAFSVYSYCKESGEDVPESVNKWKEFASKFTFPSVRNVWEKEG